MRWLLGLLVALMFALPLISQEAGLRCARATRSDRGTFSDLRFDESTQRLVGAEIRIVATEDAYQASLQQFAAHRRAVRFSRALRHVMMTRLGGPDGRRASAATSSDS